MDKKACHFSVDSKEHCFLCLNKTSSQFSFQDISRYLKIDMKKVFIDGGPIPPHLLAKVEKSKLKVELCEDCAIMTENISKLCRQLEKLKLEIESGLESIHGKILESDQTGRAEQFRRDIIGSEINPGMGGWMEILDVVRMETMQRCSNIIRVTSPRLQIQRLTTNEIHRRTLRIPKQEAETMQDVSLQHSNSIDEPDNENWALEDDNQSEGQFMDDFNDEVEGTTSAIVKEEGDTRLSNHTVTRMHETAIVNNPPQKWTINPDNGKYKCQLCSIEYSLRRNFIRHYKTVHVKVRIKCKLCGKEFTSGSYYKIHHQSVHMGVRFQCQVCKKIFSQKNDLRRHQRRAGCVNTVKPNVN